MEEIAIRISFALYFFTFCIGAWEYVAKRQTRYTTIFFSLSIVVNLLAIIMRGYALGHLPFAGRYDAITLYVFATALITLLFSVVYRYKPLVVSSIPLLLLLMIIALTAQKRSPAPLMPILRTPLFGIHVILVFLGYAFYTMNFSLCFHIKSKQADIVSIIDRSVKLGAFFIGAGIAIGAVWASLSWGNWWAWDPKETWALITFLIYIMYLHMKNMWKLSDTVLIVFMVAGFASLITTFLGINLLQWSIHSY